MGVFLSMEGMDGAGKSTQIRLLADWLASTGREVTLCRDPGSTPVGERIREILLDPAMVISVAAELHLYLAARRALVDQVIRPALAAGRIVLCDRFILSTVVYQGHAGGLDPEIIWQDARRATEGLVPDWMGVLDLEPEASVSRRQGPADRMEQKPADFHRRVRAGYLAEAARDPQHIRLIDASPTVAIVHEAIQQEDRRALAKT